MFLVAAVERDIRDTIGITSFHPSTKILCLCRRFAGLPDALNTTAAATYTDVTQGGPQPTADTSLQSKLENLYTFLEAKIGETAIKKYEITWQGDGIQQTDEDHKRYLEQLCEDFVEGCKHLIELNRKHTRVKHKRYPLFKEVVQHSYQCAKHCAMFAAREGLLARVEGYMIDDSRNCKPLVIHGKTGTGKSALMSAVEKHSNDWVSPAVVSLIRYVNTTGQSIDICSLLYGICHQMAAVYNLDLPLMSELARSPSKLVQLLRTHMEQVAKHHGEQRPLLILVDDIDQLPVKDRADTLHWLPAACPKNVYFVVSMHSDNTQMMSRLQKQIPPENFVEVDELLEHEIEEVLDSMLTHHNWSLTAHQREALLEKCQSSPNPLFMYVMVKHALDWHCWTHVTPQALPAQLEDAFMKHIFTLEDTFGPKLVDCTLGCLSLFQHGVSQVELREAACSDDTVLKELFRLLRPKEESVVPLISSRLSDLLHMLQPLLHKKYLHGTVLLSWAFNSCHALALRKVFNADGEDLENNPAMLNRLQKLLTLFRQNTGLNKTIQLARNLQPKHVDCQVRPQPTVANNVRKLHLLPQLLCRSDVEDSKKSALKKECLCNFDWLLAKLSGMGVDEVLADFKLYERRNREVDLIRDFLITSRDALALDPTSLAPQLLGCIPSLDEEVYPLVMQMMLKARTWLDEAQHPTLVPMYQCFPSPLDADKVKVWGAADILAFEQSGRSAVIRNKDGFMEIWDMENYERSVSLGLKLDKVTQNVYADDRRVLGFEGASLKIWEIESGMLDVHLDLRQFVGNKISSLAVFCFARHFDLVTLLTSDEDFNQSVIVVDTASKSVVYKLDTFDVKDEFFKNSAAFAQQELLLVFANARSQILDNDVTVDTVKLNVHNLRAKKKLHITACGESKLHKMLLKDDKLAIVGWQDCSFDIFAILDGSLCWHLSAPDSNLYTQCYYFTEDEYMVALTTTTKAASHSQWALWFWNIEENASG